MLEATKRGLERWGFDRVTIDDIAAEAKVSRATLYRLFPGGKDVLFEALRVCELEEFFTELRQHLASADNLEDLLTVAVVESLAASVADEHLAAMLAGPLGRSLAS
ncbi:MAG: helix-turn-helix domain-containing protein [Ilumatobacteraceae bacterium]